MRTSEPDKNDEVLSRLLRRWDVNATLPPGFRSAVWRRVERSEKLQTSPGLPWLWNFLSHILIKPAVALIYLMVFLVAGSVIGWSQAQRDKGQLNERLGQRYVRSIDPYQRLR